MTKERKLLPWVLGAAVVLGIELWIQLFHFMQFDTSDDSLVLFATMGIEGGQPARFHLYVGTQLMEILAWLNTVKPGIPWFTLVQLLFMAIAIGVIVKCVMQCGLQNGGSQVFSAVLALLTGFLIGAYPLARPQYSTTAGLLGAAAAAQLFAQLPGKEADCRSALSRFGGVFLSGLLLTMSYQMRLDAFPSTLPFWLLALGYLLYQTHRAATLSRPLIAGLLAGVLCLCFCIGWRAWEKSTPEGKEFFAFHEARTQLMDYHYDGFNDVSDELLSQIGLSRAELAMLERWYFMDEDITAEAMNALAQNGEGRTESVLSSLHSLEYKLLGNPHWSDKLLYPLCLFLFCFFENRRDWGFRLCSLCAILGGLCMLLYLAWSGRLLPRTINCALTPATASLSCLAACRLKRPKPRSLLCKRTRKAALSLCVAGLFALAFSNAQFFLSSAPDSYGPQFQTELTAYALDNQDMLIFYKDQNSYQALPRLANGVPSNMMLCWGNWNCRTPDWYEQLARFGIDGHHFQGRDFLRENVLLATPEDAPYQMLLDYIEDDIGGPVAYTLYGQEGMFRYFRFAPVK